MNESEASYIVLLGREDLATIVPTPNVGFLVLILRLLVNVFGALRPFVRAK